MIHPRPLLPTTPHSALPHGAADGAVIPHVGRYARESVLLAFEMIGGVDRLADWATKNPDLFYTRLYTKVITREVEVHASEGIEDLLHRLDAGSHRALHHPDPSHSTSDAGDVEDADYEFVTGEV